VSTLDELGNRHKELQAELEELKPKLHAAMRKERAKMSKDGKHQHTQSDIMQRSGYKTIQQVRVILGEVGQ
jgi:hypothetical protein